MFSCQSLSLDIQQSQRQFLLVLDVGPDRREDDPGDGRGYHGAETG